MGFFSAHVISEIVMQTDVRIKKQERARGFSGFGAIRLWPQNQKKTRVRTHPPKHGTDYLHGQKYEVCTSFLYLIFLLCKQP